MNKDNDILMGCIVLLIVALVGYVVGFTSAALLVLL